MQKAIPQTRWLTGTQMAVGDWAVRRGTLDIWFPDCSGADGRPDLKKGKDEGKEVDAAGRQWEINDFSFFCLRFIVSSRI